MAGSCGWVGGGVWGGKGGKGEERRTCLAMAAKWMAPHTMASSSSFGRVSVGGWRVGKVGCGCGGCTHCRAKRGARKWAGGVLAMKQEAACCCGGAGWPVVEKYEWCAAAEGQSEEGRAQCGTKASAHTLEFGGDGVHQQLTHNLKMGQPPPPSSFLFVQCRNMISIFYNSQRRRRRANATSR